MLRRNPVPALVAITALASTFAVWRYVSLAVDAQQRERFTDVTRGHHDRLAMRLGTHTAMLRAGRGLVEALGRQPTAEEFRRFVEPLELARYHPGIQGYGYSRWLAPAELPAHVQAERARGRPGYHVWPEGERGAYSSVLHLEPLDWRNRRAIGYDMYSEPTRREAMARAADSGEAAATGRVELVQESGPDRQAGFLLYVPVYAAGGGDAADLTGKREALRGWVYAPFRASDLVEALGPIGAAGAVGVSIYDGEALVRDALLYEDARVDAELAERVAIAHLEVGGRTWTLRYAAAPAFATGWERSLPNGALSAGLVLAALLAWLTGGEARARRRAELAAARAAFLAESGTLLAGSLDTTRTLPEVARLAAERVTLACMVIVEDEAQPFVAVGHRDPQVARRLESALRAALAADAATAPATAIRERRPERRPLDADLDLRSRAPAVAAMLRDLGVQKELSVPLFARDEALGSITFLSARLHLDPEDVAVAEDLARLAVAAIDTSRLYARAQAALRERDDFLSVASHELKTPLTSLLLQSEALRKSARRAEPEVVVRKAEVIRRNVDRLSALVSSLLDLSRIASGKLEIELEEVDLSALVREASGRFEEEARRAGCELTVDAADTIVGRWDPLRLDQVLTNLLANAIKYGPGQPVEVRLRREEDAAVLSVRDHGIGISEADQRRIFERFERAVSKRNYGGFGLGLWISRQIVQALGGEVRVASAPGEGATFTVTLPGVLREGAAVQR